MYYKWLYKDINRFQIENFYHFFIFIKKIQHYLESTSYKTTSKIVKTALL